MARICYHSDQALDALALKNYDIILLDINIKGSMNGIEIAHIINEKYHKPFVFVTSFADSTTIGEAKTTLPAGYVVKPFDEKEIYTAIEIALFRTSNAIPDQLSRDSINKKLNTNITEKELKVILDITNGMTNNQLASKHFVSENTIKTHIKNIYIKLSVHSKAELVKAVMS